MKLHAKIFIMINQYKPVNCHYHTTWSCVWALQDLDSILL